jgi:hypothetical protein
MKVFAPALVLVSVLNATGWDTDMVVPATRQITVDHITQTTAGHGVFINPVSGAPTAWSMLRVQGGI